MTYDVWVHRDDRREYVGVFSDLDVALREELQSPLMEVAFRGRLEMAEVRLCERCTAVHVTGGQVSKWCRECVPQRLSPLMRGLLPTPDPWMAGERDV